MSRFFQLLDCNQDGEVIGILECTTNEDFNEDEVGYHWTAYCKEADSGLDADEFSEYISDKTNEVFVRIFLELIYN